uniref:Uncharacterized protein n=1 Tax=viral metagenome TaxID=1070528 RepID=A0A6M3ITQ9_9ZZZZ
MWTVIGGIIQLALLMLSKWLEEDAKKKQKQEDMIKELTDAIAKGDTSSITATLSGLR